VRNDPKEAASVSVKNFSTTKFKLYEQENITIGQIEQEVKERPDELLVLYDRKYHMPSVVIPKTFRSLTTAIGAGPEESAFSTGLLRAIQLGQVIVRQDQPAERVARLVEAQHAGIAIVVQSESKPIGLFVPSQIMLKLPMTTTIRSSPEALRFPVSNMTEVSDLSHVLRVVSQAYPNFESGRINLGMAEPLVCDGDAVDGPHFVNRLPCPLHPGSSVSTRRVIE
jgi:hypothetical protein